jgi:hypothetical protein
MLYYMCGHTNATKTAHERTKKGRNNGRSDSNAAFRNASSKRYPARFRGEADDIGVNPRHSSKKTGRQAD